MTLASVQMFVPRHQSHHAVEEVCFFMATAHKQFSIEKWDVKNAFLQGTFDDSVNGELAA